MMQKNIWEVYLRGLFSFKWRNRRDDEELRWQGIDFDEAILLYERKEKKKKIQIFHREWDYKHKPSNFILLYVRCSRVLVCSIFAMYVCVWVYMCMCGCIVMVWATHFEQFHFANSKIWYITLYKCTHSTIVSPPSLSPSHTLSVQCTIVHWSVATNKNMMLCVRASATFPSLGMNCFLSISLFGLFSSKFECLTVRLCRSVGWFPSSLPSSSPSQIKSFFTSMPCSFHFVLCTQHNLWHFVQTLFESHTHFCGGGGAGFCRSHIEIRHMNTHSRRQGGRKGERKNSKCMLVVKAFQRSTTPTIL